MRIMRDDVHGGGGGEGIHERGPALLLEELLQVGPLASPVGGDFGVEVGSFGDGDDEMQNSRSLTLQLFASDAALIANHLRHHHAQVRKTA